MNSYMKREISCRITRTLLMYVREGNNGSLGTLLDGLDIEKEYLLDSNNWISHSLLQILYDRMIRILEDENAVYKMALASERFQSLGLLDRIARLLGNPGFLYAQAPKYNRLFKSNGDMFLHEQGDSWVVLEDRYHDGVKKTKHDCNYTRGVLAAVPTAFDMPVARVEEIECQVSREAYGRRIWNDDPKYGSRGCIYRIRYDSGGIAPPWKRLFKRRNIYRKAIDDLLDANRRIQEKYDEVRKLAADLESANRQLTESKRRLEINTNHLKASERRYRLLAENVTDIIWTFSLEKMRFTYVSPSVQRIRGITPEEAMEQGLDMTLSPQSLEEINRTLQEELLRDRNPGVDPNRSRTMEVQQRHGDGTFSWAEATMSFIRDEEGRPLGIQGVTRDITERKKAEKELSDEKERLAVTLQSIGDGVITTDRDGRVTLVNRVAEKLTGWPQSEALGRPLQEVFRIIDEETRKPCDNPVKRVIENGKIVGLANGNILISRNGTESVIADSGAPILDEEKGIIGLVLVFRDVTENRRMEKEIFKFEKLESLGVLAGGIAHDFNNFLAGIIGNLSLAMVEITPSDKIFPRLEEMEKAAMRAKDLTQQLLTFSKGGDPVKSPRQLTNLVKESAEFALRGSNVRCDFNFHSELRPSEVDEGQITQVIHNLTLNAIQAMPEGGVIHVSGENIDLPPENDLSLKPGEYVKLVIQDQGIGIKKQHIKKVFDPYFTTKQKGSGLGLATVYAIIDKHNGRITVESELGTGTTFTIYLPATDFLDVKPEKAVNRIESGAGKILVMDDEDFILELASQMLKKLGYRATLVADGEEAIGSYREAIQSNRAFDAVILDLTIPGGMGGKETIKKLLEIDNNVKAIVSSGYSNDPVMSNYRHYGFQRAVKKPYGIRELSEALHSVLMKPGRHPHEEEAGAGFPYPGPTD